MLHHTEEPTINPFDDEHTRNELIALLAQLRDISSKKHLIVSRNETELEITNMWGEATRRLHSNGTEEIKGQLMEQITTFKADALKWANSLNK